MKQISVYLNERGHQAKVGTLHIHTPRGAHESSTFVYDQAWTGRTDAFPLQPHMPLSETTHHFGHEQSGLPGIVRDAAPDRWGRKLIARAASKANLGRPVMEVDYLLGLEDYTRIGALRFAGPDGKFLANRDGRQVPPLVTLRELMNAAKAVEKSSETADDLKLLLGFGSPLGGARPKSAILDKDGSFAIAKFPSMNDERNIAGGEVLCSALAVDCGINTAHTRLVKIMKRPVSIVRRFDRLPDNQRLHFASALTMLGMQEGVHGTYDDIAYIIRRYSPEVKRDLAEMFKRATFNVLASSYDDHLRNHAFIHADGGKWRLSPAYDVNPVPAHEHRRELATWLSEQAGPAATVEGLLSVAGSFSLKPNEAREAIQGVAAVLSRWRDVGRNVGLSDAELKAYETAFEHDEAQKALKLGLTHAARLRKTSFSPS